MKPNHDTAINELTIIRDIRLNNAMVAHSEGNSPERDRLLEAAASISRSIRLMEETDAELSAPRQAQQ